MRTIVARKHRGGLAESLATARIIPATWEGLRAYFDDFDGELGLEPYAWDARIGWDTYIVTIDGNCVGFTNGPVAEFNAEAEKARKA